MRRGIRPIEEVRREPQPGRKASIAWLRMCLDVVLIAAASLLLFVTAWLRLGISEITDHYSSKISAQIVFQSGLGKTKPAQFVSDFNVKYPEFSFRLISEAELRGMLALQDPWMTNLPQVSLASFPDIAEMVAGNEAWEGPNWSAAVESLRTETGVDYVIFDDARVEAVQEIRANVEWYSRTVAFTLAAIAGVLILISAGSSAARLRHFLLLLLIRSVLLGAIGSGIGYGFYRMLAHVGAKHFAINLLETATIAGIVSLIVGLWILAGLSVSIMGARNPQPRPLP